MFKEETTKTYQRQAFKQINIKKQCLAYIVRTGFFSDFDKIHNKIQKDGYKNEEEKLKDQKELNEKLQNIKDGYLSNIIKRNHHQKGVYSPDYYYATQIQNLKKQDKLVQTLANFVKHKNEYYIQGI